MNGGVNANCLKPYPAYKDSGVAWLGQVPEEWEVKRLKFAVVNVNEKCSEGESDSPFIALEHIESWTGKLFQDETSSSDGQPNAFEAGDVLFCKLRPYLAKVHVAKNDGNCTTELLVLRSESGTIPEYLHYFLLSRDTIDRITASTYGAKMPRANWEFIGSLPYLLPSKKEQQTITAFLDRECARIDAAIEKKRRLLELLEEKRRTVITQAVTRGLDPSAPMKGSGVEWLGQTPEGWGKTKLKYVASDITDCPHETPEYATDGFFLVIRTADIKAGILEDAAMYRVEEDEYLTRIRRRKLKKGDIVYSREGERWGLAAQIVSDDKYCLGQRMMQFTASSDFDGRFLMWQLNSDSVYRQGQMDTMGATSPHINVKTIANYTLSEPSLFEQQAIAAYLDAETAKIDAQRQAHEKSIALLQEYRAALITSAVTGKIDVRGYA